MSETPTPQENFLIWTERLRTPPNLVVAMVALIAESVESVAVKDPAEGVRMEAALFERGRQCLGCADPLHPLRLACADEQTRCFGLLNNQAEQPEQPRSPGPRKPRRDVRRNPRNYR